MGSGIRIVSTKQDVGRGEEMDEEEPCGMSVSALGCVRCAGD